MSESARVEGVLAASDKLNRQGFLVGWSSFLSLLHLIDSHCGGHACNHVKYHIPASTYYVLWVGYERGKGGSRYS